MINLLPARLPGFSFPAAKFRRTGCGQAGMPRTREEPWRTGLVAWTTNAASAISHSHACDWLFVMGVAVWITTCSCLPERASSASPAPPRRAAPARRRRRRAPPAAAAPHPPPAQEAIELYNYLSWASISWASASVKAKGP